MGHTLGRGVLTRGDIEMRKLVLLSTFAALLGTTGLAGAQQESFFNEQFCAMPGSDASSGFTDCSFHTWDQCIATARGLGRWCTTNPLWHGPRQQLRTQSTSLRRNH